MRIWRRGYMRRISLFGSFWGYKVGVGVDRMSVFGLFLIIVGLCLFF